MQHRGLFAAHRFDLSETIGDCDRGHGLLPSRTHPPARTPGLGLLRRPASDPIEPVAQQVRIADRAGFLRQDEERGLKGILGVVRIAQEALAHAQDHRSVSRHQRREGGLGLSRRELLQQLAVALAPESPHLKEGVDRVGEPAQVAIRHG